MRIVELRAKLLDAFQWRGDKASDANYADVSGWWRDPQILAAIGPALAALHEGQPPSLVLGLQSSGSLLGPLVAQVFGVGFVEVRKDPAVLVASDPWVQATTPPDYRDRHLRLGFRRASVSSADRVLLVDDWIETGGQALGVQSLVEQVEAHWLGTVVIVDGLESNDLRRTLGVRALLHRRDLR